MTQATLGSISSGTMRPEDLIPVFLNALADCGGKCRTKYQQLASIDRLTDTYWESEEPSYDLDSLFEALESYAPPFAYFGTHEGDGADYGFWLCWEAIDDAIHDGVIIKVEAGEDRTTSPGNGDGVSQAQADRDSRAEYYLSVTDHGNMTLYTLDGEEIWSVV